jgi:TetR/AcrR family fatty acid metabolism transcriptional regulator
MKTPSVPETGVEAPAELSSHDRILLSARTLFASSGYENTTTSQIARNAGTSESQLIKHFGSKEGLLEAIFERAWQGLVPAVRPLLEASRSPTEKLTAVIDVMFQALESDQEMRTLLLLEGRRIRRHGHMVVLSRGFTQMVTVVDAILHEMHTAGQLRDDLHPEAARSALMGAFEGLLRDRLLADRVSYPAGYDQEEMRAAFRAVLAGFLPRS